MYQHNRYLYCCQRGRQAARTQTSETRSSFFPFHQVKERLSSKAQVSFLDVHVPLSRHEGICLHEGLVRKWIPCPGARWSEQTLRCHGAYRCLPTVSDAYDLSSYRMRNRNWFVSYILADKWMKWATPLSCIVTWWIWLSNWLSMVLFMVISTNSIFWSRTLASLSSSISHKWSQHRMRMLNSKLLHSFQKMSFFLSLTCVH